MAVFLNYISKGGILRAFKYKYRSKSESWLYNNITGPLAQFFVNYLPETLSPNTLTLIAFFFSFIPHLLIMYYTQGNFDIGVPGWLSAFTGIMQFCYNMLDNMDGKQARRVNASTPLGMLYDHGLDTITGWIVALNFCMIIRSGSSIGLFFMLIFTTMISFYLAFWEQKHVGTFSLGMLSPVDEGLLLINLTEIATYYLGSEFWIKTVLLGIPLNSILIGFGAVFSIMMSIDYVKKVLIADNEKKSIAELYVIIPLLIVSFALAVLSPSKILNQRMITVVYCFGLAFSKVIGHLQLSHCTGDKYDPWRANFVITVSLITVNLIYGSFLHETIFDEDRLLDALTLLNLISYLHYILSISFQFQSQLNLSIFGVPPYSSPPDTPTIKNSLKESIEDHESAQDSFANIFDIFSD